jgi:hypothetical protein
VAPLPHDGDADARPPLRARDRRRHDRGAGRGRPIQLFGAAAIGPGGVDATVELDPGAGVFSYEYALEGRSDDDRPARGAFSVMRPPDRPTPDKSTPVVDPLLKAKIVRARELLQEEYVTDEDLIRLGEQGAFDDLVEDAGERPPSLEAAPMPPSPPR